MLHKILIWIRYEEQEYENYFHAYLENNSEIIEGFSSAEMKLFAESVISHIPGFASTDRMDLYLAQSDEGFHCPIKNAFEDIGVFFSSETNWTDEDAYEILKKMLEFQGKRLVLRGKNKKIGHEDDNSISISYISNAAYRKKAASVKKKTVRPARHRQEDTKETPADHQTNAPTLAQLMYQIAERR